MRGNRGAAVPNRQPEPGSAFAESRSEPPRAATRDEPLRRTSRWLSLSTRGARLTTALTARSARCRWKGWFSGPLVFGALVSGFDSCSSEMESTRALPAWPMLIGQMWTTTAELEADEYSVFSPSDRVCRWSSRSAERPRLPRGRAATGRATRRHDYLRASDGNEESKDDRA